MKRNLFFLILIFKIFIVFSQPSDNQQYPPVTDWYEVKSPHFRVIVSKINISEGQRVANLMENNLPFLAHSLKGKIWKYNLILSNHNLTPNAYVSLIPRKSEFYPTPIQSGLGTNDWYRALAIHEGRHMVQIDKLYTGNPLIYFILGGNTGLGIYDGLFIPMWFSEGDAVITETALSQSGRGRLPSFNMGIRTKLLSDEKYSYYRAYNGSFRNYYPNHYELGYQLVKHGRSKYGTMFWEEVYERTVYTNSFRPFFKSIRRITDQRIRKFHKEAFKTVDSIWTKQQSMLDFTPFKVRSNSNKSLWTNYDMPVFIDDSSILAYKYGLAHIGQYVIIDRNGNEKTITPISSPENTRTSYAKGKLTWIEEFPDLRWGNQSWGRIAVYHFDSDQITYLGDKSRFISSAISPDGSSIAGVEFNDSLKCSIKLFDTKTGILKTILPNPDNSLILAPAWSADSKKITYVRTTQLGKTISIQDIGSGFRKDLILIGHEEVSSPVFYKEFILFHSGYSGIDNIYAIDTVSLQQWQITSSRFGAFNPAVDVSGNNLVYSDYTSKGLDVALLTIDTQKWVPKNNVKVFEDELLTKALKEEYPISVIDSANQITTEYPVKKYQRWLHTLNPHTWYFGPFVNNSGAIIYSTIISNDVLNYTNIYADAQYELLYKTLMYGGGATYKGFYPIIDINYHTGYKGKHNKTDSSTISWKEDLVDLTFSIPLTQKSGIWNRSLLMSAGIEYQKIEAPLINTNNNEVLKYPYRIYPMDFQISASNVQKGSYRDINPPLGQQLLVEFKANVFKSDYKNQTFDISSRNFFPGLVAHHSLRLSANYHQQNLNYFPNATQFRFIRGYIPDYSSRLSSFSIDYGLPLFYPDISLGWLMYIKRLRANIHYDYGQGSMFDVSDQVSQLDENQFGTIVFKSNITEFNKVYSSAGLTLVMDFVPFGLPSWAALISMGARYSYLIPEKRFVWEFVIGDWYF